MKLFRVGAYLMLAGAAAACTKDSGGSVVVLDSLAGLRYMNLVADTTAVDFRIVDVVSYAPAQISATFRTGGQLNGISLGGTTPPYSPVAAGTRHIRVFLNGGSPAISSTILLDTLVTFASGTNYTFYAYGYAKAINGTPTIQAAITQDNPVTLTATQVGIRVVNLATTLAPYANTPLDLFVAAQGGAALVGPPAAANVATGGVSSYAILATGTYKAALAGNGTLTPIVVQANMPVGTAGTSTTQPVPGTLIGGSAITVLAMPQASPNSAGAPFSFQAIQAAALVSNLDSTVTATTTAAHGFVVGNSVNIAGADTAMYNGTFTILTVPTTTTFTYRASRHTVGTPATGFPFALLTSKAAIFNGIAISKLTSAATTATVVTQSAHGLANNNIVTISGAIQPQYNGSFAVTVVNSTTFTYTTNGTPAASPATGPVVWRAAANDFTAPAIVFMFDQLPLRTAP